MSFLVVFNSDGAAVDLDRVERMNPEWAAQNLQVLGRGRQVALIGPQPGSAVPRGDATYRDALDGRFWLIGRVRLDAREELCSIIFEAQAAIEQPSDAQVLLAAYARWGDRCLEHLRGDFCFVLWDEDRQRLFCGRDQFGVRPLFYAMQGNSWIVSDSLDIVAEATARGDVDEYWVADFLISGFCADLERTVYKRIKRLPPAHFLTASAGGFLVQKYWTFEVRDPIYYASNKNYVEHFHEVVALAVKDRLPQGRVGISMSGGLDSSTLAAHALRATGDASKIIAHTRYFEHLIADSEKHFSSLVASRLGIPLTLRANDDACYDPHWHNRELRTSEPNSTILSAVPKRIIAAEMAEQAQVWFYGEGPDNALVFEWQAYLRWLFTRMDWCHLTGAVIDYLLNKQAREWRSTISNRIKRQPPGERRATFRLPQWLNEGFVKELQLIARARQFGETPKNKHPWHPIAIGSFNTPRWQYFLEQLDPSISGTPLAWRHPYLDLRVLTFLLSVPPVPWARRKRLIREAMRGCLPKEVLCRDKAPLSADPLERILQKYGLPRLSLDGAILRYIDQKKLPNSVPDRALIRPLLRVYVLDSWLKSKARRFSSNGALVINECV
jgi:asparagine synthase (glutamine-hydrolysing)